MDSLHAIGFYVSAAVSLGGGLLVAFLPARVARGAALGGAGLGIAGLLASLSADLAAGVALVSYVGCGALVAGRRYRALDSPAAAVWRQVGAAAAAALFAVLAYSAWRGDFVHAPVFRGGEIGAAALGRLMFAHDALATEAVAALVLASLAGATVAWRMRERGR